ncbi:MAG: sulfotransferase, partial [Desulfohalobiaceae bacterium]
MKILYITGLGRSGTNLLDLLLDSHSQVRALGGVRRLPRAYARMQRPCTCGAAPLSECRFWAQVDEAVRRKSGRGISALKLNAPDSKTFQEDNRLLFEAAAEVSGTPYITDSSKSSRRLRRLLAAPDLEVIPVHVHRDPRGYAYSQSKRKKRALVPAFAYTYRSLLLYRILHNRYHGVIRYERLAEEPEEVLAQLTSFLDLPFEKDMLNWAEQTHHSLGANDVIKKTSGSELRLDNAWHNGLPASKQLLINWIAWPGRLVNRAKERDWG